ncbi:MAG: hypothetical protein LBK57_08970 [Clostridiales Family XIII bacterium]|nr:hypothetical protein [Clostridiales Family XIII bacterium]
MIDYEQFCGIKQDDAEETIDVITALELKARLDAGESIQIIDIREPHERAFAKFSNAKVMPLGQLTRRIDEFDRSRDAVFLCKAGQRSVFAICALRKAGYTGRLLNLKGGMNAWARDVDPSLPQY